MTMTAEHYTTTVGRIEITVAPPGQPPWRLDAIIEEQDTSLLLGDTHVIRDTCESYTALVGKMKIQAPLVSGQVLVRHTRPGKLIAIVYDIGKKPVYREEWIAAALLQLFEEMEAHRIRNIAMPLLGVTHGRYPHTDFLELLCSMAADVRSECPQKIWLITPAPEYRHIIAYLEKR
ncbi:MAG: hypothetical protein ACRESK_02455 [Gammaproteobacteria bacterium]